MTAPIHHWIDGAEVSGSSGRTGPVFNPATGEQTGAVDLAGAAEVVAAIDVATRAARDWRHASLSKRAAILFAFRELLHARMPELAAIVTAEHGKVLGDAEGEIARGLENVEFATGVPHLLKGSYSEQAGTGVDVYSIRQPLGVVAGITPFNFPVVPYCPAKSSAVILVIVGVLGISMADNVLRPILLAGRTSASGLVVFLGILGGAGAFGFIGLVLGPIILVTAGSLLKVFSKPTLFAANQTALVSPKRPRHPRRHDA